MNKVPLSCIIDTSKNEHFLFNQNCSVSETTHRLLTSHLYLINPSHIFDVQNRKSLIATALNAIFLAVITSIENHEHFIEHTALLFNFLRVFS